MPISRPGHQTSAPMSKTVRKIFQPFGLEEPRSEEHPAMIQSYKPEDSESGAYAISLLEKVAKERLGGPATRDPPTFKSCTFQKHQQMLLSKSYYVPWVAPYNHSDVHPSILLHAGHTSTIALNMARIPKAIIIDPTKVIPMKLAGMRSIKYRTAQTMNADDPHIAYATHLPGLVIERISIPPSFSGLIQRHSMTNGKMNTATDSNANPITYSCMLSPSMMAHNPWAKDHSSDHHSSTSYPFGIRFHRTVVSYTA